MPRKNTGAEKSSVYFQPQHRQAIVDIIDCLSPDAGERISQSAAIGRALVWYARYLAELRPRPTARATSFAVMLAGGNISADDVPSDIREDVLQMAAKT